MAQGCWGALKIHRESESVRSQVPYSSFILNFLARFYLAKREVKLIFKEWLFYKYPLFSLAVHPDRITIATGQVAGTSKDGKVSCFISSYFHNKLLTRYSLLGTFC